MYVLGIDPGQTTGVCTLRVEGKSIEVISAEQISWIDRKIALWTLLTGGYLKLPVPQYAVVENFRLRPGRAMEQVGSTFPSVEVIGLIEAFQFVTHDFFQIVYQEPSAISRVAVLPEHASLFVGKPHAMDAYKHARYFSVMQKARK